MARERESRKYGILELVQASGVPRRTIRYYVQRGLLSPPEGAGRGHYYRSSHLGRLVRIRELQDSGLGLEEIRTILDRTVLGGPVLGVCADAPGEAPPAPMIELITRINVGSGIDLVISHGERPPTASQVRAIAGAVAKILEGR